MIPGSISRLSETTVASAASISAKSDIVKVTGTTQINTILPLLPSQGQFLILIPTAGSVILGTSGNILIGITAVINRAVFMCWSPVSAKWYINSNA